MMLLMLMTVGISFLALCAILFVKSYIASTNETDRASRFHR